MNITVNQKRLFAVIKNAERVVSKNNTLPILQTVLLKTLDGTLHVFATNLEIGVDYQIPCIVKEDGSIAVPVKIFSDFITHVNDHTLDIKTKGNVLHINSQKYKTQILCFNSSEFPIIPSNTNSQQVTVNSLLFKNSLLRVIDSASLSDARPELSGVYINFDTQKVELAATDVYRLSEASFKAPSDISKAIIVPRNTILELIRILNDNQDISIYFSDNQIFFENNEFKLVSRLIDGRYPDYKNIIPNRSVSLVRVSKKEFEKAIKTASVFSSSIADITLKLSPTAIEIAVQNSDKGEINVNLACELKNDPFELRLNYNYILDGLKSIDTENAILHYTGEGSPLVLKAEDKDDFTYLIMPLRS